MSLEEDVGRLAKDVKRLEKIATQNERTLRSFAKTVDVSSKQEKRMIWQERACSDLSRDVRAQGTYGKRLTELDKTLEKLAKALADLEKDIAKRDADNQAQKDIKKALKQAQDAQKDAMNQFRKMNVDARLTTLEKGVKVAMTLASARR